MTDQEIINHLNSISDLLAALSLGTEKMSVEIGYHKDMSEQNRYSLVLSDSSWKGIRISGWGHAPAEAFADLRRREEEAARKDAITAQVEQYRAELEKVFLS